jgi:hypothetical protein
VPALPLRLCYEMRQQQPWGAVNAHPHVGVLERDNAGDTAGKRQRAVDHAIFADDIVGLPVSDRGTLGGVTQFAVFSLESHP